MKARELWTLTLVVCVSCGASPGSATPPTRPWAMDPAPQCKAEKAWCEGRSESTDVAFWLAAGDNADYNDNSTIICIDATEPSGKSPRVLRRRDTINSYTYDTVLSPNHAVDVRVVRAINDPDDINITMAGAIGETTLETSGATPVSASSSTDKVTGLATLSIASTDKSCGVYEQRFAPRVPGLATVSVTLTKHDQPKPPESQRRWSIEFLFRLAAGGDSAVASGNTNDTSSQAKKGEGSNDTHSSNFELLVPHLYSGALRLGLSAVYGVGDHAYSIQKTPGSDVGRLIDNGGTLLSSDLVVGYAPFWEVFTGTRGRDFVHAHPLRDWRHHLGLPYFGLGVATAAPSGAGTKVEWLRSVLVGAEYELFQNCSIALVFSARRVDQIAAGLVVGGPVADSTQLTESRIRYGVGLVLNFTPDFLKFAASVGAK